MLVVEVLETIQFIDNDYWLLEHLLGWAVFLAWMNLTLFLARFDLFGKHIYLSWHVLKKVGWSLVVYVPSVIAFSMAFHSFLRRNDIFQGSTASVIKVLTMLLGEFDFADNFLFDKVKDDGDSNFSVQVIFIYGLYFFAFPYSITLALCWLHLCVPVIKANGTQYGILSITLTMREWSH